MKRRNWSALLAVLFVAQLVWYLAYTDQILQALRSNAQGLSEIFARVQEGITDPRPGAAEETLFQLQGTILDARVPLIVSGPGDTVTAAANLPFPADLNTAEGQARVLDYARRLDLARAPIGDPAVSLIHFGDPPEVRGLRWIPWFQAVGLLLTGILGFLSIRLHRRAEGEKAWTAMARELAHQLGTPISSLQGWLELLRLADHDRPEALGEGEIAEEIGADLVRLERISHRFELIGREPELEEVDLKAILDNLERYLMARIPRFASGVTLELDLDSGLPPVRGNAVLLTWAFENVVNNALDALGGEGGAIRISAAPDGPNDVLVTVSDSGPGVDPEIRQDIFDPGITTKESGWGVGLALSRRIVEGVHKGRISLAETRVGDGATFQIRLPAGAPDRSGSGEGS